MRQPRIANAFLSVFLFGVIGPVAGLLMLDLQSSVRGSGIAILGPFALIGAYAIGAIPALIAGLLYCVSSLALAALPWKLVTNGWLGGALGLVSAALATYLFLSLLGISTVNKEQKFFELLTFALPSGYIAGTLAGFLLPVGSTRSDHVITIANEA